MIVDKFSIRKLIYPHILSWWLVSSNFQLQISTSSPVCQEEEARFFDCQFIIATHSPFLLSLRGAKIYDFDGDPVDVKRWTQLNSVKAYFEFFEAHRREFRQSSPSKQEK